MTSCSGHPEDTYVKVGLRLVPFRLTYNNCSRVISGRCSEKPNTIQAGHKEPQGNSPSLATAATQSKINNKPLVERETMLLSGITFHIKMGLEMRDFHFGTSDA